MALGLAQFQVSDGTGQFQRLLPALQEGYFNVEEMRFEQLLALARDYARIVRFFNLDNRADGVWDSIFSANELVVIATILSINTRKLEAGFEQRLFEGNEDISRLFKSYRLISAQLALPETATPLSLAQTLDYWLHLLRSTQSSAGDDLRSLIESVVVGLRQELQTLVQLLQQLPKVPTLEDLFSPGFIEIGFVQTEFEGVLNGAEAASPQFQKAALRSIFSSLIQALDLVQAGARRLLPQSMTSEHHDPAVGLLVAFVKLYQKLQTKINGFTEQHLDFYYQQVLKAEPQALVPDRAHLVLQLSVADKEVTIAKDTEFVAGIDQDKRDIIYAADQTVVLNDARVERLLTLFLPQEQGTTKACWLDNIAALPDGEAQEREQLLPHALLGAPRDGKRPSTVTQARLGFALASNVLLMKEGRRRIRVSLQYDAQRSSDKTTLEAQVRAFTLVRENASASAQVAAEKDAFFKIFSDMFQLSVTGTEGWIPVDAYLPSCSLVDDSVKENCLTLEFNLPQDQGAVVPYQTTLHEENFNTALPLLRFTLKPNEYQYPYDILRKLALKEARIDVLVQGCRELLLHNNIGQLSPLAPFAPFGPLPNLGSYFIVGYDEIRTKQLSGLDVEVEWGDLPPSGMDFNGWYRSYSQPPKTSDFVINVSLMANGKWLPSDSRHNQPISLFGLNHEYGRAGGISTHRRLSCDAVVAYYKPQENHQANHEFVYSPSTKSGLFKFTLAGPVGAFGHQEYPHLLSQTLTHNTRVKNPLLAKPIPRAPYTPQITAISLNYSAYAVISFENSNERTPEAYKEKLLHLHPAGWESLSQPSGHRVLQVPQYDALGNLFVGLKSSRLGGNLTLYFHLHRDSLPMPENKSPRLQWWYLQQNQWLALDPRRILADSTEGFMTSGIITLELPLDWDPEQTLLPPDLYWLRVSGQEGLENFSRVYSVYAQAIQVSWRQGFRPGQTLSAGSITRPRNSIPGLGKVSQVCRSIGGKAAEESRHVRTRLSERLRHKNRALTPHDYELLILEAFPEIYKVKCFANMRSSHPGQICPGHVLIVPLPYLGLDGHQHYKPRLSGHLIHAVREFVQKLAPPFATISVENPLYEEIQVRCTITLQPGLRGGYYSNLLNQDLCEYLSAWNRLGYTTHFGWCIRQYDLESYIQSLDYIEQVSDFSMLRVAPNGEQLFTLDDSARRLADGTRQKDITPKFPWSVAVPIAQHYIQTTDQLLLIEPKITGVEELEVGSTLIISAKDSYGQN